LRSRQRRRWTAFGFFARERENVAQEGFDALVHRVSPPPPFLSGAFSK
jgi:hypothetical protein